LQHKAETWTEYQKRLLDRKLAIKKARLEKMCQDEVFYKTHGRKLAREVYPANRQ
jgi:hypothetical protein